MHVLVSHIVVISVSRTCLCVGEVERGALFMEDCLIGVQVWGGVGCLLQLFASVDAL